MKYLARYRTTVATLCGFLLILTMTTSVMSAAAVSTEEEGPIYHTMAPSTYTLRDSTSALEVKPDQNFLPYISSPDSDTVRIISDVWRDPGKYGDDGHYLLDTYPRDGPIPTIGLDLAYTTRPTSRIWEAPAASIYLDFPFPTPKDESGIVDVVFYLELVWDEGWNTPIPDLAFANPPGWPSGSAYIIDMSGADWSSDPGTFPRMNFWDADSRVIWQKHKPVKIWTERVIEGGESQWLPLTFANTLKEDDFQTYVFETTEDYENRLVKTVYQFSITEAFHAYEVEPVDGFVHMRVDVVNTGGFLVEWNALATGSSAWWYLTDNAVSLGEGTVMQVVTVGDLAEESVYVYDDSEEYREPGVHVTNDTSDGEDGSSVDGNTRGGTIGSDLVIPPTPRGTSTVVYLALALTIFVFVSVLLPSTIPGLYKPRQRRHIDIRIGKSGKK